MRAVEHATTLDGVRPTRLFGVLWPLWQVDVEAEIYEHQAYEVLDRFVVRGIGHARLSTVDELSRFFGLDPGLVRRVLEFLALIQHVEVAGDRCRLTPLGQRGLAADVRYVPKKGRQYLLFDRMTMRPLPRSHYSGDIRLLDESELPGPQSVRLVPLFLTAPFQPDALAQLAARPDRTAFNLPVELASPKLVGIREVFLPAYLVETADGRPPVLAYSMASTGRDTVLEELCDERSVLAGLVRAEPTADPRPLWEDWLARKGQPATGLRRLPSGVWRVTLPAAAFGTQGTPFGLAQLGSFAFHKQHFAQLWCTDGELRRTAVLHRVSLMSRTRLRDRTGTADQLALVARQLEVDPPAVEELSRYATNTGRPEFQDWLESPEH